MEHFTRSLVHPSLLEVMGVSFTFLPIAREVVMSEINAGTPGKEAYGKFLGTCILTIRSLLKMTGAIGVEGILDGIQIFDAHFQP